MNLLRNLETKRKRFQLYKDRMIQILKKLRNNNLIMINFINNFKIKLNFIKII